jgi:hypothetical protein
MIALLYSVVIMQLILAIGVYTMSVNLTNFDAALGQLKTDVAALIAAPAADQAAIDTATTELQNLDASVKAALPVPPAA